MAVRTCIITYLSVIIENNFLQSINENEFFILNSRILLIVDKIVILTFFNAILLLQL